MVVDSIFQCYPPNLPKLANLRSGLWYYWKFDGTCYFKSTDGHYNHWNFPLSRLNLHVIQLASQNGGVFIVDATKKGKNYPDALSKTIPIWCCVINRTLAKFKKNWDTELHLPIWVPKNEASQIEKLIPSFVELFEKSGVDLTLLSQLEKPLRCLWINPQSTLQEVTLEQMSQWPFIPIICVSASNNEYPEKMHSWTYIPGSGDDYESWGIGLTPQIFWDNVETILHEKQTREGCEKAVEKLVSNVSKLQARDRTKAQTMQLNTFTTAQQIGKTPFFIASKKLFPTLPTKDYGAIIVCDSKMEKEEGNVLYLSIIDDKKYKLSLQKSLSKALKFIEFHLRKNSTILLLCETGN